MNEIKILLSNPPNLEIIAICPVCNTEMGRLGYNGYADYGRQLKRLKAQIDSCEHCGAIFREKAKKAVIPWGRTLSGDYIAKAKNGDFLVWKDGGRYKWRYRVYGGQTPEIHFARTKQDAMAACERHGEWIK